MELHGVTAFLSLYPLFFYWIPKMAAFESEGNQAISPSRVFVNLGI